MIFFVSKLRTEIAQLNTQLHCELNYEEVN